MKDTNEILAIEDLDFKFKDENYRNERLYSQNLYYLKQAFLSDNKDNIAKFVTNYFRVIPFKAPKDMEDNLDFFYFCDETFKYPYEERYITANGYTFENIKDYLFTLNKFNYFDIDLNEIYQKFEKHFEKPFNYSLNMELFLRPAFDAIYFNMAKIFPNGKILLGLDKRNLEELDLLDFLIGYREKKYVSTNFSFDPSLDKTLLTNPSAYWDYLNESIYLNESKYTVCASTLFPFYLNLDNDSLKKQKYINSVMGNLYAFKAIYNSIMSEKFRNKVAYEYVKSEAIYSEDNIKSVYGLNDIETLKSTDQDLKTKWVSQEILNFSENAIKGTLGTELLLTPFMLYKFVYFSKTRIFVNFNKYGIWEEFSKSAKDKSILRLRIQTIVDIMFSINLSDLDYKGISSKKIISTLLDRILGCLDFYKDEEDLELFIQSSSYDYINFKDFVLDLRTGETFEKQSILQNPDVNFATYNFTRYTLSNREVDINFNNLFYGLNFSKYIDKFYYEFDKREMDKYLEEHFTFSPSDETENNDKLNKSLKKVRERIISRYDLCHKKFAKIYCSNQEENSNDKELENDDQEEDLTKDINTSEDKSSEPKPIEVNSFEEFLNLNPFEYFLFDEKDPFFKEPISEKSTINYFKSKNIYVSNKDSLDLYLKYCEINNLKIDKFIQYKNNGDERDERGQSTEFHKKLKRYFRQNGYFYEKDSQNPNILYDNLNGRIPLIFNVSNGNQRGYLGITISNSFLEILKEIKKDNGDQDTAKQDENVAPNPELDKYSNIFDNIDFKRNDD